METIKKLITIFSIPLLISCSDSNRPREANHFAFSNNPSFLSSPFIEDNFMIAPENSWTLTHQSDTFNSYQHQDLENQIFYRINVYNLTKDLSLLGLNEFNEWYLEEYFNEYINNLIKDKWEYQIGQYLGRRAIFSDFIVTNESLINQNEAILKSKMVTFLDGTKSYTLSVISKPELLDFLFKNFSGNFKFICDKSTIKFNSPKYNYSIIIPGQFSITESANPNIDLKLTNEDGASIIINVSKRQKAEYKITAHDYSKEYFEQLFKPHYPYLKITGAEKIYIDNNNAFLIRYQNYRNESQIIEIYFYRKDFAYLLTGTTPIEKYKDFEVLFNSSVYSLKFN